MQCCFPDDEVADDDQDERHAEAEAVEDNPGIFSRDDCGVAPNILLDKVTFAQFLERQSRITAVQFHTRKLDLIIYKNCGLCIVQVASSYPNCPYAPSAVGVIMRPA